MRRILILVLGIFWCLFSSAEESSSGSERILKQRAPVRLKVRNDEELLSPKPEELEKAQKSTGLAKLSISTLMHTVSFREDLFNRSFGTWGTLFLASIPLTRLAKSAWLHGELGLGVSYVKASLIQPVTTFTHLEFPIPITLRLLFALSRKVTGEIFAGALYRPLYYESRPNTSGGFQSFENEKFIPEGGVGFRFPFSSSLRGRIRISYSYLAGGLEFIW